MTAKSFLGSLAPLLASVSLLYLLTQIKAQDSLAVPLELTCSVSKFFDTSSLQCTDCPQGSFPNSAQTACVSCDPSAGNAYDFAYGFALTQSWSPAILAASRTCACQSTPSGRTTVIAPAESNGTFYQRCVVCPSGTAANAVGQCAPSNSSGVSIPPSPAQQLLQALQVLNVGMTPAAATQVNIAVPSGTGTVNLLVQQSQPLVDLLGPAAMACYNGLGADRAACNAVANLCALTLYDSTSGPCRLYDQLVNYFVSQTGAPSPPPPPPRGSSSGTGRRQSFRPATGNMPWLYYSGSGYLNDLNMNLRVQFSKGSLSSGQVSRLTFVLSAYLLNGTWLGYNTWTSEFQLCGAPKGDGSRWWRFGWNYDNHCKVKLEMLLTEVAAAFTGAGDTVMYELFLQVAPNELYPIPIAIQNMYPDGLPDQEGAVRRFFYMDARLGYSAQTQRQLVVQYPSLFYLTIMLRKRPRDSIYVPQLEIKYMAWETDTLSVVNLESDLVNGQMPTAFRVRYINEPSLVSRFWYAWQTVLIVFEVALAFPALILSVFRYIRKKRESADLDFLVYMGVCVADYGSFALTMALLVISLYYLIIYKLQEEVYFMMLQDYQLKNFRTTVILAIVGQSLGLLWFLYRQLKTDVFFIDWEKPRKVLSKEGAREEPAPVSCWRILMVANEFNELQTVRVTYPAFTMLMMVMILEGANVIASGAITPDANDYKDYFGITTSIILRFGVEAFFLLVLFLGQYLFKRLIYYPYVENPVTQFIDLMFLANVSTVIFDDSHSGYYLHGRNQAQHSDTTLKDLNQELLKEEEGLTSQRGLVNSSSNPKLADNQLFLMYVTDNIRKTYDAKMLQLVQQATNDARNRKGMVSTFLRGSGRQKESVLQAYQEVTLLFKQMLEEVERNQAQQVIDPTYLQMVLQLPPDNAANNPAFVHDYFSSFTNTMFIGSEVRLYVYEAIFFCAIDMNLKNVAVSALLTFVMTRVISYFRAKFGEDNLSQKTLVDRHFLI